MIAIPTTSGTGSEVTCYSTVWDSVKKKLSLNNNFLYPQYAIVDPELTYGLALNDTINTGLDALNQAFESFWNKNSNFYTEKYAAKSIINGITGLKKLSKDLKKQELKIINVKIKFVCRNLYKQNKNMYLPLYFLSYHCLSWSASWFGLRFFDARSNKIFNKKRQKLFLKNYLRIPSINPQIYF